MSTEAHTTPSGGGTGGGVNPVLAALAWIWVLVPFGYGLYQLVIKIPALFGS
jgi:hypothetical protein